MGVTASQQAAATDDPQIVATLRAVPRAIELLADGVVERFALAVQTQVKGDAALDAHSRKAAVTGFCSDGRAGRQAVALAAAETGHGAAGPDERALAVGTRSDRTAGLGRGPSSSAIRRARSSSAISAGSSPAAPRCSTSPSTT